MFSTWVYVEIFLDYEDDVLNDYSERPELTQFDSQRPLKPVAQSPMQLPMTPQLPPQFRPEPPQFRPEPPPPPPPAPTAARPLNEAEQEEDEEDDELLLPEVTEASQADQPDLFSFPQNLDGFGDTFLKFSADRPESIGRRNV